MAEYWETEGISCVIGEFEAFNVLEKIAIRIKHHKGPVNISLDIIWCPREKGKTIIITSRMFSTLQCNSTILFL